MKHGTCKRSKRLIDLAHDMFERDEISLATYRSVCDGAPPPCEDRACAVCFRQSGASVEPAETAPCLRLVP